MTWTVLVAYCMVDDLLKVLGHRDDPQSKTSTSGVLTLWILAALEHGGLQNKALERCQELGLFCFVPSRSRFNRRLHALSHLISLLLPQFKTLWQRLGSIAHYILKTCLPYGQSKDTLPLPLCENIRAPRCRLAPGRAYRGYIPSKRLYFHGLKLHLLASNDRFICEVGLFPGATAEEDGLYLLPLDLAEGSELYVDRGYTEYPAEDDLQAQGIQLRPIRMHNSKRYHLPSLFIATLGGKILKSLRSALTQLFPKRIRAFSFRGFDLQVWGFVFAHNCKRLASVL